MVLKLARSALKTFSLLKQCVLNLSMQQFQIFSSSCTKCHFQIFRNEFPWFKNPKKIIHALIKKQEFYTAHQRTARLHLLHSFYWLIPSIAINSQLNHLRRRETWAAKHSEEIKFAAFNTNTAILARISSFNPSYEADCWSRAKCTSRAAMSLNA